MLILVEDDDEFEAMDTDGDGVVHVERNLKLRQRHQSIRARRLKKSDDGPSDAFKHDFRSEADLRRTLSLATGMVMFYG